MCVILPHMDKLTHIQDAGAKNLQLIVDFDRTLIKGIVDGTEVSSALSILRKEHHLGGQYSQKAQNLFDIYHAIEIDPTLSHEEKYAKMNEWWVQHLQLMQESGLQKKHIIEAAHSPLIQLRPYVQEVFTLCYQKQIPLYILSANGLGYDSIASILEKENIYFDTVHIISNELFFDDTGTMNDFKEPVIHSLNKNESLLPQVLRPNTILIGDSVSDARMVEDKEGRVVYRVGIHEYADNSRLSSYKEVFDEVIESKNGDAGLRSVYTVLQTLY
jgi:cytosolic 5'-nucleotidase 3